MRIIRHGGSGTSGRAGKSRRPVDKLADLLERGVITAEELPREKDKVLA